MEKELVLLKRFEEDSEWFHKNINKLRKNGFTGKFVAIKNSEPIASGKNVEILIKNVEKKGDNPSLIFMEFVHPEGYILIL